MNRPTTRLLATLLPLLWVSPAASVSAAPIDEFRLSEIEQNLRNLESIVREQGRQIAELQRQSGVAVAPATPRIPGNTEARWLNSANWSRVKPGLSELQVIELLGPATQQRAGNDGARSLLYAMEIGRSGFLTGRVVLTDGKVSAVEIPTLK